MWVFVLKLLLRGSIRILSNFFSHSLNRSHFLSLTPPIDQDDPELRSLLLSVHAQDTRHATLCSELVRACASERRLRAALRAVSRALPVETMAGAMVCATDVAAVRAAGGAAIGVGIASTAGAGKGKSGRSANDILHSVILPEAAAAEATVSAHTAQGRDSINNSNKRKVAGSATAPRLRPSVSFATTATAAATAANVDGDADAEAADAEEMSVRDLVASELARPVVLPGTLTLPSSFSSASSSFGADAIDVLQSNDHEDDDDDDDDADIGYVHSDAKRRKQQQQQSAQRRLPNMRAAGLRAATHSSDSFSSSASSFAAAEEDEPNQSHSELGHANDASYFDDDDDDEYYQVEDRADAHESEGYLLSSSSSSSSSVSPPSELTLSPAALCRRLFALRAKHARADAELRVQRLLLARLGWDSTPASSATSSSSASASSVSVSSRNNNNSKAAEQRVRERWAHEVEAALQAVASSSSTHHDGHVSRHAMPIWQPLILVRNLM